MFNFKKKVKEIKVGTKSIKAIWTKEMHEDLIKQEGFQTNFEKHLTSVIRAEKRKNVISKIYTQLS